MKSKTVSLTYEFGAIDAQLCAGGQVGTLSVIRVLFGFEALRQAAKRAFSKPSGGKLQPSEMMLPFLGSFENEGEVEELTVSGSVVEQVFMKTVSQAVVAVIASSGAAEALIQSSTAASLAPLEDLTFLSRASLSELAE
uniref:Protein ovary overexpressed n=1 Tax=Rhipicephalus microplus TaxID=6941 RepID=A0A6M2D2N0_RHIMP